MPCQIFLEEQLIERDGLLTLMLQANHCGAVRLHPVWVDRHPVSN
jgi:hypothetical protein